MHKLALTLAFVLTALACAAQEVTWSVDMNSIFDNREGSSNDYYCIDQTLFLTRLAPEIGIRFLPGQKIAGGVSWIQPVGNGWRDYKICPTLYYNYNVGHWRMNFGMFPRTQLMEPMPTVLWSDSLAYHEPNIRGMMLQYMAAKGYAEAFLDWRSLQSETHREAFNLNFNGIWNPCGALLLGGHLQYSHLAKQKDAPLDQGVNDDVTINPYVGLNLAKAVGADSLVVKAGYVQTLERDRSGENKWKSPKGALIDIVAEKGIFGVKETMFAGENIFPLYGKYGHLLNLGDPYFQAPFYSRTNVYAYIVRNQFVNLVASLDYHYTKEEKGFWQKLLLRVYLDNGLWKHKHNMKKPYLKNLY